LRGGLRHLFHARAGGANRQSLGDPRQGKLSGLLQTPFSGLNPFVPRLQVFGQQFIAPHPQRFGPQTPGTAFGVEIAREAFGQGGLALVRQAQINLKSRGQGGEKTVRHGKFVQIRRKAAGVAGIDQARVGAVVVVPAGGLAGQVVDDALRRTG